MLVAHFVLGYEGEAFWQGLSSAYSMLKTYKSLYLYVVPPPPLIVGFGLEALRLALK